MKNWDAQNLYGEAASSARVSAEFGKITPTTISLTVLSSTQHFHPRTALSLAAWLIQCALEAEGKTVKDVLITIK